MFSKLNLVHTKKKFSLKDRIEYSTVNAQTIINLSENKFRESNHYGFVINDSRDINNNFYLVIPLHGLINDVKYVKITRNNDNNVYKYNKSSFYKNKNLDLAILVLKKNYSLLKEMEESKLITINDLNLKLDNKSFEFNFKIHSLNNNKIIPAIDIELQPRRFVSNNNSKNIGPSITFKTCYLDTKQKSYVYARLCNGMSGLLSFSKNTKFIDSIFSGTSNDRFLFLPMIYLVYFIDNITNKVQQGMNYIPLTTTINKNNNICVIKDYYNIKKNDILVAINNQVIDRGYVFSKELNSKIPIDQFIMLFCKNDCDFTIIRNFMRIECNVKCIKVN